MAKNQSSHVANVKIVSARCRTITIAFENGMFDQKRITCTSLAQDAILVVVEIAAPNGQITTFIPNSCPVFINHFSPRKFKVFQSAIATTNHDDTSPISNESLIS